MSKKKKNKYNRIELVIVIILLVIYALFTDEINETYSKIIENINIETTEKLEENNNLVKVYFIDVGQADCILIQDGDKNMLIDAGNNIDGPLLVEYFKSLNIKEFKYVIATHPHEDHIGGLDDIINNFNVKKFFMPDLYTTTKTFEEILTALENKNLTYTIPKIGQNFILNNSKFKIIYFGTDNEDLNESSMIIKLTYNNISFLFTADTTTNTENKILTKDISADILKVAHHGSRHATSNEFLERVNPQYAIITVEKNNDYNLPSKQALKRLNDHNIKIYRTDILGTIQITTNGQKININNFKTNTNMEENK